MTAPDWLLPLLGFRKATEKQTATCMKLFGKPHAPNIADASMVTSTKIAGVAYKTLGITRSDGVADLTAQDKEGDGDGDGKPQRKSKSTGTELEHLIRHDLAATLPTLAPERSWQVETGRVAWSYRQFDHLKSLHELFDKNPALRSTVGRDYHVRTDVCVGLPHPAGGDLLHAAVSSKWSLRSDRAQNVRQEFATLVRNRRGRLPHLVLVTAEPMPSRLLSTAGGTGEIDAVYHLLFDEIAEGVKESTREQIAAWNELVDQGRLRPYAELGPTLACS